MGEQAKVFHLWAISILADHVVNASHVLGFTVSVHCSEEFNSGFGSHTPMILGQAKVVRYFPNCER